MFISGASSLGSVFRETNELESIKVVHHAIKSGINYIDVAPWYGHGKAEIVLGKVIHNPYTVYALKDTRITEGFGCGYIMLLPSAVTLLKTASGTLYHNL